MASKIVHSSGTRKESTARATIKPGTGVYRVNSMLLENFSSKYARERVKAVLLMASDYIDLKTLDIIIEVDGGGVMGQADAISCAVARSFVEYVGGGELQNAITKYDRTLIAGDHRETEPHKPSQSSKGPRHKRQKSYR